MAAVENRLRFLREVIQAVARRPGDGYRRHAHFGDEKDREGLTDEIAWRPCSARGTGLDYVNVIAGTPHLAGWHPSSCRRW